MKNSGGVVLLLIGFVVYVIIKNWLFILVVAITIGLTYVVITCLKNSKKDQPDSKVGNNLSIECSKVSANNIQYPSRNNTNTNVFSQHRKLLSLIESILNTTVSYHTLKSIRRIQSYERKHIKYSKPVTSDLYKFILNCTNTTLNTVQESTHKNRIIAECETVIQIITELEKGVSNEQICSMFFIDNTQFDQLSSFIGYVSQSTEHMSFIKVISRVQRYREEYSNQNEQNVQLFDYIIDATKNTIENLQESTHKNRIIAECKIVIQIITELEKRVSFEQIIDGCCRIQHLDTRNKEITSPCNVADIITMLLNYDRNSLTSKLDSFSGKEELTKSSLTEIMEDKIEVCDLDLQPLPISMHDIVCEDEKSLNKIQQSSEKKEDGSVIDITYNPSLKIDSDLLIASVSDKDQIISDELVKNFDYSKYPFVFKGRKVEFELTKVSKGVPFWKKMYIYDVSPLKYSNNSVKGFYSSFKKAFFEGIYYDLNVDLDSNFYFILLFDLFDEYKEHADIVRLEKQLYTLSTCYPKVMTYAVDKLLKAIETNQENTLNITLLMDLYPHYRWKLGDKYAIKLGLSQKEKELFNRLISTTNKFSIIEKFQMEIIKLFLFVIREYEIERLEGEITILSEIVVKKYFTNGYTPPSETIERELWYCIYKSCENHIRTQYGIREKLQIYTSYYTKEPQIIIEDKLMSAIENLISSYHTNLSVTDKETEIELNKSNPTRWRGAYEQLVQDYNDLDSFFLGLQEIKAVNENNVNLKHMYYEAMKLVFKFDTILVLKLYIEYVTLNLMDIGGKEKSIPQIISKKIFFNKIQKDKFEEILLTYKDDRNKSKAYLALEELFLTKRKKIKLNALEIEKITELHSDTVKLLNSVMEDDLEIVQVKQNAEQINKSLDIPLSLTILSSVEQKLLKMFEDCNLILEKDDVELYAKSRNLMANRLIEKINDRYYDVLDDVLIEDNGNEWTIYEDYYKIILTI